MEGFLHNGTLNQILDRCQFTANYYNLETRESTQFNCEKDALDNGLFCIFHDEKYLQDQNNSKEHEQKAKKELMDKVSSSLTQKEVLFCIGYHLPDNITIRGDFTKPVYFSKAKFQR